MTTGIKEDIISVTLKATYLCTAQQYYVIYYTYFMAPILVSMDGLVNLKYLKL